MGEWCASRIGSASTKEVSTCILKKCQKLAWLGYYISLEVTSDAGQVGVFGEYQLILR